MAKMLREYLETNSACETYLHSWSCLSVRITLTELIVELNCYEVITLLTKAKL